MLILKKIFHHKNIKMSFYSFVDPVDGNLWMGGIDIAKSLGYSLPKRALRNVVNPHDRQRLKILNFFCNFPIPDNFNPSTMMINEFGLYSLVAKSKLKNSTSFKSFIRETVLKKCHSDRHIKYSKLLNVTEDWQVSNIKTKFNHNNIYGHFYIATNNIVFVGDLHMIGSTLNLDARLKELNKHSADKFKYSFVFYTKYYRHLENFITKKFKSFKVMSEFHVFDDNINFSNLEKMCIDFCNSATAIDK